MPALTRAARWNLGSRRACRNRMPLRSMPCRGSLAGMSSCWPMSKSGPSLQPDVAEPSLAISLRCLETLHDGPVPASGVKRQAQHWAARRIGESFTSMGPSWGHLCVLSRTYQVGSGATLDTGLEAANLRTRHEPPEAGVPGEQPGTGQEH
jgi:hypothetical protein